MRPRNVLTETNNMRKLMGLPLLNEDTGSTAADVKKKVLNESTIEYENNQWLVIEKEDEEQEDETTVEDEEQEDETTVEDEDVVEEQEGLGDGSLGIGSGIDVDGADDIGDGEDGMGESPLDQVVAEGSFAKYNISLGGKVGLLSEQDNDQTQKKVEKEERELEEVIEILNYEVEQAKNKKSARKSEIKGILKKIRGNRKLTKVINKKGEKLNQLANQLDDLEDTEAFKEKRKKIIRDIFLSLYAGIGAIVIGSSAEDIKNKIKYGKEKVNNLFN